MITGCSAPKCETRHYAKGYCKKHWTQVSRHGGLTPDRERGAVRVCEVEDCGRTDTIKRHCRKHARQLRVHGRLTPEREHLMGATGCSVKRCKLPHRAKGLCAPHYNQNRWAKQKANKKLAVARSLERTLKHGERRAAVKS